MTRESDSTEGNVRDGLSRDKRRLFVGVGFMALTVGSAWIAVFVLGRPTGGETAPGVPFLVASGWVLVLAAAVVFHRSYSGEPGSSDPDAPDGASGAEDSNP